jgi:hypothetical protein
MATNHPDRTIIIFIPNPVGKRQCYLTRDYTSLMNNFCILFEYLPRAKQTEQPK